MSRAELGAKVGLGWKQIGRYERGERYIDSDKLRALAEALVVPVAYLFDAKASLPLVIGNTITDDLDPVDRQQVSLMLKAFTRIADVETRAYLISLAEAYAIGDAPMPLSWQSRRSKGQTSS